MTKETYYSIEMTLADYILRNQTTEDNMTTENTTSSGFVTKDKVIVKEGFASKFDSGKARMDLLPMRPLKDIAEILTIGAEKYGAENWRTGEPIAHSRHFAGIQRHLMAYWSGEDYDPETGKSHLAHAACGLLFYMELAKSHPEKDDRCKQAVGWND